MVYQIIECVANFSEGRDQVVIESLVSAISSVRGVKVINVHSDSDHNRTVVSFLGLPQAVGEAAYQGVVAASKLIDMDKHRGQHPRIGAADVIPFVPVQNVTMHDCVVVARELGQRLGHNAGLPVYLYEYAAFSEDRRDLAHIRRGGYEALKSSLLSDGGRLPDYGPALLGKAGAVAVGARYPLIAFNVYLATGDIEVARKVARSVRYSSGGLRYVNALGLLVDGHAQVSLNLTDYTKTPLPKVLELIRREAHRYGVLVKRTELVGLLPLQALIDVGQWYLQLNDLNSEHILEAHLADRSWLD